MLVDVVVSLIYKKHPYRDISFRSAGELTKNHLWGMVLLKRLMQALGLLFVFFSA